MFFLLNFIIIFKVFGFQGNDSLVKSSDMPKCYIGDEIWKKFDEKVYEMIDFWLEKYFARNILNGKNSIASICKYNENIYVGYRGGRLDYGTYIINNDNLEQGLFKISSGTFLDLSSDKSDDWHMLVESVFLRRGISYRELSIQSFKNHKRSYYLYSGTSDGLGGGCDRSDFIGLEVSTRYMDYKMEDQNSDGYSDIVISAEETDCKTNRVVKVEKVFFATENGFLENDKF